jgi:predicted phage-related endonuclease
VTKPTGALTHPDLPWMFGHLDGWTPRDHPRARLLEVKTAQRLDEQWGDPGTGQVPMHYFCQVQHYLAVTGFDLCDVAVLVQGRRMDIWPVPRDQAFIDALVADETTFWERVKRGIPPNPDGSESAGAALRRMYPRVEVDEVVATPEMALAADEYLHQRHVRDQADKDMDRQAQRMQAYMGAHGRMLVPGAVVAWADRAGSRKWKEVAATYRDLLVPHYDDEQLDGIAARHTSEPTRVFSVTKKAPR